MLRAGLGSQHQHETHRSFLQLRRVRPMGIGLHICSHDSHPPSRIKSLHRTRAETQRHRTGHLGSDPNLDRRHLRIPFLRHANIHLIGLFAYLPQRPAYNERLRNAVATMQSIIAALARECPSWHDDLWLVDSTPVDCGRSRETVKRSDMAGCASYGHCASHSRFFWGLRLHLITPPPGLPVSRHRSRTQRRRHHPDPHDHCSPTATDIPWNQSSR